MLEGEVRVQCKSRRSVSTLMVPHRECEKGRKGGGSVCVCVE